MKGFEFLDHEADIGMRSWGKTVEEAFENGGIALFSVMVDVGTVESRHTIRVTAEADDLNSLFVEWLNELIAQKDIEEMVFSRFSVTIEKRNGTLFLTGTATGEKLDQKKHGIKTEVKAATYFGMKRGKEKGYHFFQCVLDI
jgi:SHS2 domain-containing protein